MSQEFNDENFDKEVIEVSKTKPVLVDFYAVWCGPCKMQAPIIDEVSEAVKEIASVGKLNTDEAGATAQKYGIMSIPTIIIFKDGKPVEQFVGVQHKDGLVAALEKHK